ncbi:MAG: alpha/beta hydrolase [Pseudomonadota bacterium]|nr:alpha/beta hydrolase [Pseudomonadota bacterium]
MSLIAVGDLKLNVRVTGTDGVLPTIVLEAGGGSLLQTWEALEQALAPHTRVLSYERAGIGESTGPVDSVSAAAVARRLAALLTATRTVTPVILVGHSRGGLYSRYFAATRPELIVGLVLLDSSPEEMPLPRFYSLKPTLLMWLLHGIARIGLLPRLAARRKLPLPPPQLAAMRRFRHVRTALAEMRGIRDLQAEIAATALPRNLPILAISAAGSALEPQELRKLVLANHEMLAAAGCAPYSRHQTIAGADHMSMITDPQHAASIAEQILGFARQLSGSPPV